MRSIKVLPESVRSLMRSGIIVFDLTRVVEELVFNSLDAGATKVIVAVNVGTHYIKVTDNGCGIARDGLVLLGERYATSKFEQLAGMNTVPESFGFRGEALSSISDVSLLEVVTKAHGMPNGYRKVIKGCKCLYLGIDDERQDVGTTVVVRDLFYNQPVKRRHIRSSPKKVLHLVKECILRIALVHLQTCFKVIDIESGDELLSLYPSSSPLPILMSGFGNDVSHSMHKLDECDGTFKLSGYISGPYETFSVKAFQYFYINSRYIYKGAIHKLLNQLAAMHSCSDMLKAEIRSECGKRSRCQVSPTYILNLTCPRAHYDLSFEPSKTCVAFKDWDPVFTFIKKAVSCFWNEGTHMSEKDTWNEDDASLNRDDLLNTCGLPKKRFMTKFHQDSVILSSPQLERPRYSCNRSQIDEHMDHFSDVKWTPKYLHTGCSTKNSLVVKEPSAVSFHFDDDGENIDDDFNEPFLKSCSARMDVLPAVGSTEGDDEFRFQADTFKKWLYMADRVDYEEKEADYINQGSGPWFDEAATVWLPRRITTTCNLGTDSRLLSKAPLDSILSGGDCLLEDNSHCISPVAKIQYSNSSNPSSKCDLSTFSDLMHVEPVTDVVSKRHFKHSRNDGFDLFAFEEGGTDIFNFDYMRPISSWDDSEKSIRNSQNDSILFPQPRDSLYETEWTFSPVAASHHVSLSSYVDAGKTKVGQYRFQYKQRRRSCSAPPFYREKKKIFALNSWMTVNSEKSHQETNSSAPTLQEDSHLKHIQKPSGVDHLAVKEGSAHNLRSKARHDKKKTLDQAEISDSAAEVSHCLDVYLPSVVDSPSIKNHGGLDFGGKWRDGCHWTSSTKKPDESVNEDSILDITSGILQLSGDSVLPKSISKKCLEDCRVLQQVDRKFIPVIGGGTLSIIDQHAADERIRLEDLREKVLSGEAKTITYLDAEQELVLPEIGYQLLNNYSEQIQKWGWICNFHAQGSVSFKKNLNFLHNQPSVATLIAVPCILGVNLTDVDLLEFLQQLADTDGSSALPPAVLRVLNLKACRGAIMFGDALLPSECSLIVEELKQTSMCFQCAHGRPTTVPLVNLVLLHKQIAKLGNRSPGSCGPWHGLSRHRPSLERAAQRLSSEGGQC